MESRRTYRAQGCEKQRHARYEAHKTRKHARNEASTATELVGYEDRRAQ